MNRLRHTTLTFFKKLLISVRSYTRSFNGFAAYLTPQEQEKLADHEEVVSVFPSKTFQLQTTRSWDFMGFSENVQRNPTVESDTIIGVIDTGIWPESESFNDKGFGPPPKKWKGVCKGGQNFTCNNKLIGARFYGSDSNFDSARDTVGHGTHTASTAAGNIVKGASFYSIAKGTARGGVPSSRIAAYKVCSASGCSSTDILAAFDDAIADGVDLITISIGANTPEALENDPIAIASFHASQKGILVIQAAGNSGFRASVVSLAPWIFTVAASTIDRGIVTKVSLGNGSILTGKSVNSFKLKGTTFPLVYGKEASSPEQCDEEWAKSCQDNCLQKNLVKGKIVLCDSFRGRKEALRAGALGSIGLQDEGMDADVSFIVPLPASALTKHDFSLVESYVNSTKSPKVDIQPSESIQNLDAPRVATFSSRGPNSIIPDILKPDVTAPGVDILAAFSPKASPSEVTSDKRSVKYSILSGTSMSCPHVAGAAAYIKTLHPDWSPSAIKSALMTTAWRMNVEHNQDDAEFAYGSGHIDPVKAADPGLVYETVLEDYIKMLCGLISNSTLRNFNCSEKLKTNPKDLNYPSMTVNLGSFESNQTIPFTEKFTRTVTNVGCANSTYKAKTSISSDYSINVNPSTLTFGELNEKKTFEVTISGNYTGNIISAALEWSDGVHNVRSPIVVYSFY
ncbi:hypothetical protein RD792_015309 [Penstemon davidsonii]|uniref:Cucumisin n=1 Tax=Penstemon davidsonii TaxID=160366 RepID=A0ABR0CSM4_9LAMI|nr:hypothetical protein RD792_015309 [Penstemon davidsonii]